MTEPPPPPPFPHAVKDCDDDDDAKQLSMICSIRGKSSTMGRKTAPQKESQFGAVRRAKLGEAGGDRFGDESCRGCPRPA